jgi:radical SAM superfamily enzyme with C-terminal helix-hairpin-helix motif
VGTATSAALLAAGATWRLTGVPAAGRALVTAATTGDENDQVLARMMLVKAGNRSVPIVTGTLLADPAATALVDVLASIGTEEARQALRKLSHDAQHREAATEALRTLDEIRRRTDDSR